MPRLPRPQIPNGLYHVVVVGVRKSPLYHDSPDWREMVRQLATVAERYGWRVLAYCLMTNHFHLVVKTVDPTISRGMQWLNSRYAEYFNRRYRLEGHALERRFWSKVVKTENQLPTTIRYVLRNPVRAGICAHPGEWRWSSYRATARLAPCPPFLGAEAVQLLFATDPITGAKRFAEFVSAPDREAPPRLTPEGRKLDLRA
jgi:putative transposase